MESRRTRKLPAIRGTAIATQREVNGEKPPVAAGIVLLHCAEGPLTAFELAMHFERDVAGGHGHGQRQQRRHRQKSPHIHVFFVSFPFSLSKIFFYQTNRRNRGRRRQMGFMDARGDRGIATKTRGVELRENS